MRSPSGRTAAGDSTTTSSSCATFSYDKILALANNELDIILPPRPPFYPKFAIFRHLPPELQDQIWTITAFFEPIGGPLIHNLYPEPHTETTSLQLELGHLIVFPRIFPSLLRVCERLRHTAKQQYSIWRCDALDTTERKLVSSRGWRRYIFAHNAHDTFFLAGQSENQMRWKAWRMHIAGIGDHPAEIRCRDVVMKAVGGDLSRYRERHPDEKIPELKVMAKVWEDHWSGQTPKCG
ncbi:hypothetical protein BDZ45DRAFT_806831 [Acephala macrosclerotiorum]|nr:hypothetical protein BDZ45DRAFT_806831 [Acephala macrosclerotiorum]